MSLKSCACDSINGKFFASRPRRVVKNIIFCASTALDFTTAKQNSSNIEGEGIVQYRVSDVAIGEARTCHRNIFTSQNTVSIRLDSKSEPTFLRRLDDSTPSSRGLDLAQNRLDVHGIFLSHKKYDVEDTAKTEEAARIVYAQCVYTFGIAFLFLRSS